MLWTFPLPSVVLPPNAATSFGAARSATGRPAECGGGHCGVDLYLPQGTPVLAAGAGTVYASSSGSDGNYIWLAHEDGWKSHYVHLDNRFVQAKAAVRAGQQIGTLGKTGITKDAAHLHFALSKNGTYVDPLPYLRAWAGAGGGTFGLAVLGLAAFAAWRLWG